MSRPLVINDLAPDLLNFLIYEENFIFFFYQCSLLSEDDIVVAELEDGRIVAEQ